MRAHAMKAIIRLLGLVCILAPHISGQQSAEAGTAAAIRALEHEWTVGQSRNDNHALDLIFDNTLIYVEYGKLVSKGDYLSRIKREPSGLDQIVMEPMTVHIFGSTAIVTGTYVERQALGVRRETKRWRFIDTWVYKKNGWVLVAAGAAPVAN
jgi:uncharacterized protein DUF4440